ncbi:MAG TPA: hypothetical protein VF189_03745, partial [Patescibacteria group bacterium]
MKKKQKSKQGEKNIEITSPRSFFIILWVATILCFIFTMDPSGTGTGKTIGSYLTTLFLGNILAGVIFFLAIFIKPIYNSIRIQDFVKLALTLGLVYFLFYVISMT